MWRFSLLLLAVFGWATFAGCGGPSPPKPLTPEQERELQSQMQQVQEQERSALTEEDSGTEAQPRTR